MGTRAGVRPRPRPLSSSGSSSTPAAPRLVNIPNGLTVLRLVLVPVFVAFLVVGGTQWRIAAFVVFAVASVTDLLDGELARRSGMITDFGKIADPIADKALTGSALITLSALGELSWWVTVVILVREVGVTALRFWVLRHGVIPASRGGKVKTVLQMLAIGLYILPIDIAWIRPAIMGATVAVTLVTGVDYVVRAVRLRGLARSGPTAEATARPPEATSPEALSPEALSPESRPSEARPPEALSSEPGQSADGGTGS